MIIIIMIGYDRPSIVAWGAGRSLVLGTHSTCSATQLQLRSQLQLQQYDSSKRHQCLACITSSYLLNLIKLLCPFPGELPLEVYTNQIKLYRIKPNGQGARRALVRESCKLRRIMDTTFNRCKLNQFDQDCQHRF